MIALYPSYPGRPREPDPAFGWEVQFAKAAGFQIAFVDLEVQFGGDILLRKIPDGEHDVVYRGWLLKPTDYLRLDEALESRGCRLLESWAAYQEAYEFPRWYAKLKDQTPRSIVIDGTTFPDLDVVVEQVEQEFQGSVLIKDYIKSRKQDWFDACFIPDVRDREHVKKVVTRFLELAEPVQGGLVFRKFETFKKIGIHPKSQMPVVNEWRGFMVRGKLIYLAPYWASGDYSNVAKPEPSQFEAIIANSGLISPFLALDLAEKEDGTWTVIEINPGGASGVPEGGNAEDFYKAIAVGLKA